MNWKLAPLVPSDAQEALELLKTLSEKGEVLYKPIEEDDFLNRFFGDKRWGFTARDDSGRLGGFIHASAKTSFLPGETEENTPLYLTMLLVAEGCRGQGVGQALLDEVKALGESIGKKSLVVSGDNPVHLAWLIPGANGHDHNNAPGVDENGMGYPLPWFFLFVTGYFLFRLLDERKLNEQLFAWGNVPVLNWLGRHSLIVYLLHQPVLYGLSLLFF